MTEKCKNNRIAELKAMDLIMRSMNHEGAYMCWINHMPDEATDDDFAEIAMDEEQFADCAESFLRIMKYYMNDGLCLCADTKWGTKCYCDRSVAE